MIRVFALVAMSFALAGNAAAMDAASFEKMMNDLAAHTQRAGAKSTAATQLDYGKGKRVLRLCSERTCFILGKPDGRASRPSVAWSDVEKHAAAHFRGRYARPDVINTTKKGIPGYAMTICGAGLSVAISPVQQEKKNSLTDMLVVQMTALDAAGGSACAPKKAK